MNLQLGCRHFWVSVVVLMLKPTHHQRQRVLSNLDASVHWRKRMVVTQVEVHVRRLFDLVLLSFYFDGTWLCGSVFSLYRFLDKWRKSIPVLLLLSHIDWVDALRWLSIGKTCIRWFLLFTCVVFTHWINASSSCFVSYRLSNFWTVTRVLPVEPVSSDLRVRQHTVLSAHFVFL